MYINVYIYFLDICLFVIYIRIYIKKIYVKYIYIYTQSILVFDTMQVLYWPVLGLIQFCSFDRGCKTCLDTKLVLIPLQNWLCACSKTSFVPSLNLLHQNRLCTYAKPTAPKPALCLLLNRLCACAKPTAPKPALYLLLNRLCACAKPAAPKPALRLC